MQKWNCFVYIYLDSVDSVKNFSKAVVPICADMRKV